MRYQAPAPLTVATSVAIALFAISFAPAALQAQEPRPDQQQQQDHRPKADGQRHDDQVAARAQDHRAGDRDNTGRHDDVDQLRREHPGAMARCHDGFFTKSDHTRACTRHGGIDIWFGPEQ